MSATLTVVFIGTCNETSNNITHCTCASEWRGEHCELRRDYCGNVTCLNNGVCRLRPFNFTCDCPSDSYSGRYCEVKASKLKIHQAVSRSFAFVVLAALITVAIFIVVLDVLKYGFGIDVAKEEAANKKKTERRKA